MQSSALTEIKIEGLKVHREGKVRTVFDLNDRLLIVASDRISAFDVILPTGIPGKGKILTQISAFWFDLSKDLVANHVISGDFKDFGLSEKYRAPLEGRSMLVKKTQVLPAECIVRGYLAGSGWSEYKKTQSVCGIKLPAGLKESDRLPEPIFTPSTKAAVGHDENISFEKMQEFVAPEIAQKMKDTSLKLFKFVSEYALKKGIIIADTKFEFGLLDGQVLLIDEIFTPDSSRFWSKADYQPGRAQDSFDKQFVRDYLLTLDWGKTYPGPELPPEIVAKTGEKYKMAYRLLTGKEI